MNCRDYNTYLTGTRVAIVAHGASIVGSGLGSEIDSYDHIVRMNASLPIPEELKPDIGSRCDILYSTLAEEVTEFLYSSPQVMDTVHWVCCPHPAIRPSILGVEFMGGSQEAHANKCTQRYLRFLEKTQWKIPFREIDRQLYMKHTNALNGGIPNTGISAVWDLLNFDVSEVAMFGYTFFAGGTYSQYKTQPSAEEEIFKQPAFSYENDGKAHHLINPQLRYFKKLLEEDSRIKVDNNLRIIIENFSG